MKKRIIQAFVPAIVLIFLCAHTGYGGDWIIDTISGLPDEDDRITEKTLAVGPDNTYHMVFKRAKFEGIQPTKQVRAKGVQYVDDRSKDAKSGGGFDSFYTYRECGGEWSEPEMINLPDESTNEPNVVVTPDGQVYISYMRYLDEDFWSDDIVLLKKTDKGWDRENIPLLVNTVNWLPYMVADDQGNLHMTWVMLEEGYYHDDNDAVFRIAYSSNISGEWQTLMLEESVLGQFGGGARPILSTSPGGVAHIAYRGGNYNLDPEEGGAEYRIHYATNLVPGGKNWEIEELETERVYDEKAFVKYHDGVVHLAIGGSDHWELPNFTYYTYRENGVWSDMEQVNHVAYGYPTALEVTSEGDVLITYIATVWQMSSGMMVLWQKSGDQITERDVLVSDDLALNSIFVDLQNNVIIPYTDWYMEVEEEEYWTEDIVSEQEDAADRLSASSLVFNDENFGHLIYEKSLRESGIKSSSHSLWHRYRDNENMAWSSEELVPVSATRQPVAGTASIVSTQGSDAFISYLGIDPGKDESEFTPYVVVGEKNGEHWTFADVPFDLEFVNVSAIDMEIVGNEGINGLHIAVYGEQDVAGKESVPVIYYAARSENEWQMQIIELEEWPEDIKMEITSSGYGHFIYTTEENGQHDMVVLFNDSPGGENWNKDQQRLGVFVEKMQAILYNGYIFLLVETEDSEHQTTQLVFKPFFGGTALEPVEVTQDFLNSWELLSFDVNSNGELYVAYREEVESQQESPLHIARFYEGMFVNTVSPQVDVHSSQCMFDQNNTLVVINQQGDYEQTNLFAMNYFHTLILNTFGFINVMRSGECDDPTYVESITNENKIEIYPNPTSELLHIKALEPLGQNVTIEVYDISGRRLYQTGNGAFEYAMSEHLIDVSAFEEGVYLLRVSDSSGVQTRKFMVR